MDILVSFPDGTTELRAANSPCAISDSPLAWTPINVTDIDPLSVELDDQTDPGLWVVTDRGGPLYLSRGRCGARTNQLRAWRGFESVDVWRITGQDDATKALTGEWQSAQIETVDEQIARLTRERDAAVAALRKVARHSATSRWCPKRLAFVGADGEPWLHWAEIARMALEGT